MLLKNKDFPFSGPNDWCHSGVYSTCSLDLYLTALDKKDRQPHRGDRGGVPRDHGRNGH